MPDKRTPEERFWSKVDRNGPIPEHRPDLGPCWLWTKSKNTQGYGHFFLGNRARVSKFAAAHRFSWSLQNGAIPEGMRVLHYCDNPPCVREAHLFIGTSKNNSDDMVNKGRHRPWSGKGTLNPKAKINDDIVLYIRRSRSEGRTYESLSAETGITPAMVSRIARGLAWRHV